MVVNTTETVSGVDAASGPLLLKHWWQWILFSIGTVSMLTGSLYIVFIVCRALWRILSRKSKSSDTPPPNIVKYIQKYTASRSQLSIDKCESAKPSSLRVYLGSFEYPATADEIQLILGRDMVILDPQQSNVHSAIAAAMYGRQQAQPILGRYDCNIHSSSSHSSKKGRRLDAYLISALDKVLTFVQMHLRSSDGGNNGFTGILLAGWDNFPLPVLNELNYAIVSLGLDVYLEVSGPNFLEDTSIINSSSISGMVIRNALILPDGQRRDCFDMANFRLTVKAFVSQGCLRSFNVLLWETLDDGVVPSNAVLKRTYAWCSFYSTVAWIGSTTALHDIAIEAVEYEPLSAFDWLKLPRVMELHDGWRNFRKIQNSTSQSHVYPDLHALLPSMWSACHFKDCDHLQSALVNLPNQPSEISDWVKLRDSPEDDPLCVSPAGKSYDGIGCFSLGTDVDLDDFQDIVWSQRNLKKLELLDRIPNTTLQEYGAILFEFITDRYQSKEIRKSILSPVEKMMLELAKTFKDSQSDAFEGISVFLGLQSGFQHTPGKQFWAVFQAHASGTTDIYVSKDAKDLIGTVVHTYLSSRGFSRRECFAAEVAFARWRDELVLPHSITRRTDQDLELMSPDECIAFLQAVSFCTGGHQDGILEGIKSAARERLLDYPTRSQLRTLSTTNYLNGDIGVEALIEHRLDWHCHNHRAHPDNATAASLFLEIEKIILRTLKARDSAGLQMVTQALETLLGQSEIDAIGDIMALAVFCTMRKIACEEIYIEVTDRNPLFNDQSDQAAAFAELFALGSRCESYFDMSPSQFGEVLSAKFRKHYGESAHQPPLIEDSSSAFPSAYAEAQIDVDPNHKDSGMPKYQHFTFLSVFAIPALIDILMLTTTGHGLYLSAKMTYQEQHSATLGLMISLLISGAVGTWITCGGTYYLASTAFSAMNYFVVTRLLGGFVFILIVATVGFIAFAFLSNISAAIVFALYLINLSCYLCLLAALANYQFAGSAFQSGRAIIIFCIPILFISPVTTILVPNYDIDVYLTVITVFVTMLLIGVRYIGSQWATWYQKVELVKDAQLKEWYLSKVGAQSRTALEDLSDPAVLKLARQALLRDVVDETQKMPFKKRTKDTLVQKLAGSYQATEFLMNWYTRYSGVPRPITFSSSWNVQTKVALESMQKSQLGIRFHNGFIHWRQAGDEIGCTMLYFILALLDKWIMLMTGQQLLGLGSSNKDLTLPMGFGLAYYLVGAVLLDFNANKLHDLAAAQGKEEVIQTDNDVHAAVRAKSHNRKILYWKTLFHYLMLHVWGLAIMSTLILLFASSDPRGGKLVKKPSQPTIIFLGYAMAYTGLLWYQYTKVFCGRHALKPLLIGVSIGFPVGFVLHHLAPTFMFSDIVALGSATWTVAILTLFAAKIVIRPEEKFLRPLQRSFRAYSLPGSDDQSWSQPELQGLYDKLSILPERERLSVAPQSEFGTQVKLILSHRRCSTLSDLAAEAFPEAEKLFELTGKLFDEESIRVQLASVEHFSKYDQSMAAISSSVNGHVYLIVGCETTGISRGDDPLKAIYQDVGELLIQVTAELFCGYTSRDAVLARDLWSSDESSNGPESSALDRQLRRISQPRRLDSLVSYFRKQLLQDLCLGIDCDIDWEGLPLDIRQHFLDRCLGKSLDLTEAQESFLSSILTLSKSSTLKTHISRCNYAALTSAESLSRAIAWRGDDQSTSAPHTLSFKKSIADLLSSTPASTKRSFSEKMFEYSGLIYHGAGTLSKFFSVAFIADPEYHRELNYTFSRGPRILNTFPRHVFGGIWILAKSVQNLLLPIFMFNNRGNVEALWKNIQGTEVTAKRSRISIRTVEGIYTGFIHPIGSDTFNLIQYRGDHKIRPEDETEICYINTYSNTMTLLHRIEKSKGKTVNEYTYDYRSADPTQSRRLSKNVLLTSPMTRKGLAGHNALQNVNYNLNGQIESGSYVQDGNLIRFQYHYRKGHKYGGALLRAEFVLPHLSCTVSWCAPPRRKAENLDSWIPHSQVTEATFVVGADVWESKYFYDHKFHPTIVTTLNGQRVDTPPLILYDHLNVLKKPLNTSILDDNPLFSFTSLSSNPVTRWLRLRTRRYPVSTSQARSLLWKAWKSKPGFDGVIVRWLDERLLRRDPVLRPYWRLRDRGELVAAEEFLDRNRDAVMASVDMDHTISSWTPLAMKVNDLYSFGQGGDACSHTRSNATVQDEDDESALHVIAIDTGTWPNEGGGVTACRSDVINNLRTIKWHMVAESANDFGIPKRQIERNIHSLKIIPLWGLDLMTPIHGLFANRLDSEVEHITTHATLLEIERAFVPVLAVLISGARALDFSRSDVKQVTRALINLNSYFKGGRHWSEVWKSEVVKNAWRRLWLSQTASNSRPSSQWLKTELPTLGQIDQALELWSRYLFIFSIPIPEKMPPVFQASHHSVSASYGIVCKIKRGCTLQIWDHAISWRETNLYLSSALCSLSPFTRNSMLGLMRMTSVLILHHADTILPCADFFNPNWEAEIGTCQGRIEHRSSFKRKIDPVVNGITDMSGFKPVKEIKNKTPTVTMLSHVWYAKDIKTALLSADIIINKWKFKDYQLDIYGAIDKSPAYTTNCQEIIATKSLRHQVCMRGEANPIYVLERTWAFLNSSISEGLPLALGEAALTGAPVVCTDVGASLRVLTSPTDGACYSAVVAPNDAHAMARAQIKILALLEEFAVYADPNIGSKDASFPENPTTEDVKRITQRMYDQSDARRRLGMMSREIVQKSFSGERYLREHEQMLWIGKAMNDMAQPNRSRPSPVLPMPAPVHISSSNGVRLPELRRQSQILTMVDESALPSLAFAESTMPSLTVPSTVGMAKLLDIKEKQWFRTAEKEKGVVVDIAEVKVEVKVIEEERKGKQRVVALRRELRSVSGVSALRADMIV